MKLVMSSLLVAVASSALVAAVPAQADPAPAKVEAVSPERLELARRFMAVTDTTDILDSYREMMIQSAAAFGEDLDDAGKAKAQHRIDRYLALAGPTIRAGEPALVDAYVRTYAREFSADELRQMIAFAQTPAGRHYLARYDILNMSDEIVDAQRKLAEDLEPVMEQIGKEMCAEKAAQRVAMGDKKAKCPLSEPDTQAG
ncbi:MAG TPA: DUF2059 domain-containing protein [Sphingomicrobium sp.]|nr:DUF2059 domain-containing protein [Sphingomicrobium sp.]